MQECRKEMPVEDDYMMVIIPCIAEIAASDTPERVKSSALEPLASFSGICIRIYWLVRLGYTETVIFRARRTWRKSAA